MILSVAAPPDEPERFGRYELLELVGEGAMAEVYRARRVGPSGFRKVVAIKRLRPGTMERDPAVREALINEARNGGLLRHPGIVEIHEFDEVEDEWYLAMEFVDGWTLEEVLWQASSGALPPELGADGTGALRPEVALDIVRQIADALAHAHEAQDESGEPLRLVHRDLKPANVFLSRRGVVKVGDFGLAKSRANLRQTTDADRTKGSPLYMSPEQVAGGAVDGRSDLFALGTLLVELCVGTTPFEGQTVANTLVRVMEARWDEARMAQHAPTLLPIARRLLQRSPDDRVSSARALAAALQPLAGGRPAGTLSVALAQALDLRPRVEAPLADAPLGGSTGMRSGEQGGGSWWLFGSLVALLLVLMGVFLWVLQLPDDRAALDGLAVPLGRVLEPDPIAQTQEPAPAPQARASGGAFVHEIPAAARLWQDLELVLEQRADGDWQPRVSYRTPGALWRLLPLRCVARRCAATLPVTSEGGLQYWLEADGPEQARWSYGSADAPVTVSVE